MFPPPPSLFLLIDGVFVHGESLVADESSATGESEHKKKGHAPDRDPFFLSGTQVGTVLVGGCLVCERCGCFFCFVLHVAN